MQLHTMGWGLLQRPGALMQRPLRNMSWPLSLPTQD